MVHEPAGPQTAGAIDVLWQSPSLSSMEHFSYRPGPDTGTLGGTVVLPREGKPTTIRYQVTVDNYWEVQNTSITAVDREEEKRIDIVAESGRWWVNGRERSDLAGCTDVDLGWTPSTNSLPIRRTSLGVGESTTVHAAWVTFPELVIRPATQRYKRTGMLTWTYQSGNFAAELATEYHGFVVRYGEDIWFAVAPKAPSHG